MIIEVTKISPDGSEYDGEESPGILGIEGDPYMRVEGPITYHFRAEVVSKELVVTGQIGMKVALACGRCAGFFSTTVQDLSFLRAYPVPEGVETVDLTEDIREDILLLLEPFAVCSPACKGLCPKCGKNLNEGACSGKPDEEGKAGDWSELDRLRL